VPTLETSLKNPLEFRLGYQLRRASVIMMADLTTRLADLDLSPAEASILILIAANPAVTQSGIGRALGVKRANMVPLIAGLISRGCIAKEPADGRSHSLQVTDSGTELAKGAQRIMLKHEAHFFAELSEKERNILLARLSGVWLDTQG